MEAIVPVVGRLGPHAAPDFDDIALCLARAAEQFHCVFASGATDRQIVAADELGDPLGVDIAVEHDHRDLGIKGFLAHARQSCRFLRRDQEHVDLLHYQVLAVGDLLFGLVLAIGNDEVDVGIFLRFGLDVLVELHAPGFQSGALAEPDLPLGRCLGWPPCGRHVDRHSGAGHGGRQFQEFTTLHRDAPLQIALLQRLAAEWVRPFRPRRWFSCDVQTAIAPRADRDSVPARAPCRR